MGDKRTKQRITSKIDELPEDLRMKVDVMLADTSNTYEYISQFLKGEGYDISKSSVGRYATRTNNAMQRLLEAQAQTDRLIQVVKENPEADYTEAAMNDTREEQLLNAGKAADAEKRTDVESLKKKYAASDEKVYTVVTTVQVDDETEDEFTFLFKKPKAASYDRYVKTMSNSVTKASKSFAFDNIIDEQRDMLKETVEEYPAITISLADKLLRMLGLADTTSVKKL